MAPEQPTSKLEKVARAIYARAATSDLDDEMALLMVELRSALDAIDRQQEAAPCSR